VKKIGILSYPLAFDAPVRGVPFGISAPLRYGKLEWCRYPMVKKISKTDGHRVTAIAALYVASHGNKM